MFLRQWTDVRCVHGYKSGHLSIYLIVRHTAHNSSGDGGSSLSFLLMVDL